MIEPRPKQGDVSIIIPALNEERVIGKCLEALTRLDFPRDSFEVILVDNGSTDRTVEITESFSPALNMTVLRKPEATISAMRNFGASKAGGKVLAFLDADCIAPPYWLKTATSLLNRGDIGVLGAHYKIPDHSNWVANAWFGGMELEKQGKIAWVPAGDMIMRHSTYDRIGGFNESLRTNEDCELCERADAAGFPIVGDAAVAVVHLGTPRTLADFYRKERWHASDGLRAFLNSLPKITNPRPLLFACYTLACMVGIVISAAAALWSGDSYLLLCFLAAWLTPAFLLSLRLALKRKQWEIVGPLTVLHLAFGIARGHALLDSIKPK